MDNKKTLLFATFTMSLLLLTENWLKQQGYQSLFFSMPSTQVQAQAPTNNLNNNPNNNLNKNATDAANINNIAKPELITLKTPLYQLKINTLGASIEQMTLNDYKQTLKPNSSPVELFEVKRHYMARQGVSNGPNHTHVFSILPGQVLELKATDTNPLNVKLSSEINGLQTIKTLTLYKDKYVIDSALDIKNTSNIAIKPIVYNELLRDASSAEDIVQNIPFAPQTFTGPAVYTPEQKFNKIAFKDLDENKATFPTQSQNGWVAMVQHYFTSAWFSNQAVQKHFYAQAMPLENAASIYRVGFKAELPELAAGQSTRYQAQLFAGPQKEFILAKTTEGLELVKDYGWAAIFAKPLFWLLDKIHGVVQNWGWAIILLTVLLKTLFYPLTASSQKSMEKMKGLQPKMAELKEKYAKEPQKMQQELVKMYRESGANPMGGCLPILIQAPVFFALYYVLLSSIEIRHAPWLGWIQDLTAADPFYILPVLMAVTMYVQIKLGPKPSDPTQAKVMMFIPFVFSFMFFFFPAGLVLYYVVNNILSILQMQYIKKGIEKTAKNAEKLKIAKNKPANQPLP